ncbi:UDP-N-acetylmuramoyl-L-alanyl-D-glutamate--2,6-diaminopimelate ligase [Thermodesulfovibrio yellowstonii]|uniref:UDP-N-acetylmuramoyl-L-alanyl-D-glutamate--2,6-diaminopimelate ligase n=1 Tax=Thermodesulfovibrio yellowstonii (strain ATCC 51303 / DSM 11347 / YP87) TaxID=289376 RepID=B5YFU0_THEYD|nr:UDP-N-acetylmuramoyl-L-alanyl-D-glutamate--2,6-diaminopimelate ligase [Thermodesulfovibrio yellowstonii]ACI21437.1 UDP-N-acetylmuramoylalanyl-D-glutamate--2,6-diaminopimelate ligase [Thermodesulfovibrio yellowstonii DSM 11347]
MILKELLRSDFNVKGDINKNIDYITYNSKDVKEASLFFAVSGQKADGHFFIEEAIKKGAKAVVYETGHFMPSEYADVTWIGVNDSRDALSWISSKFYGNPSERLKIIGITGTNGKTTTSYLIREILKRYDKKTGVIGTIKYLIDNEEKVAVHTTPEAPEFQELLHEMLVKGVEYVITEVSSHALALKRVDYTKFDIAVFTNLSRDHLDFHKDMEDYFNAKKRLFTELLKNEGVAVINFDDVYGRRLAEQLNTKKITYSIENPQADIYVKNYRLNFKETEINLHIKKEKELVVKTHLLGIPNIYNVISAVSVAVALNIPFDIIESAISDAHSPDGRFERVDEGQDFLVFVDYAHSPDALERLLISVRKLKEEISKNGKIVTVFGCGGNRDRGKRPQMGKIATELSDYVILTSDNPRWEEPREIIKEIEEGILKDNYIVVPDRTMSLYIGTKICKKGDILIVAGKGHEDYQEIKGKRYPFSDREILVKALRELR